MRQYPLRYDGALASPFRRAGKLPIAARTRAIVVVNPNIPTAWSPEARGIGRLHVWRRGAGSRSVRDEVFLDYGLGRFPICTPERALTFSMSGPSKIVALPQMKAGWIAAGGPGHEEGAGTAGPDRGYRISRLDRLWLSCAAGAALRFPQGA